MSKDVMLGKKAAVLVALSVTWMAFRLLGADFEVEAQTIGELIVINELMYHPVSDTSDQEYVELTNTGVITVDLSGWWFSDGFDYTFPSSTLLPPGGYLVVAHDPDAVASQHGLDPSTLLGPFEAKRLANSGERIALRNRAGDLVDEVTYDDDTPWPREPDGRGASLELINPTFDNDRACSWAASSGQGTPGAQNSVYGPDIPPCIQGVLHSPVFPTSSQSILITAHIDDNSTIISSVVYHKRDQDSSFDATAMVDDGGGADAVAGDGIYTAQLPPYADGSLVEFYIQATDDAGLTTRVPPNAPAVTSPETGRPVTVGYLLLVEDTPLTASRPLYRLLVTDENWSELTSRDLFSNELLDATFIYQGEIHYNVGLRYRGESSRKVIPRPYRINFPSTQPFLGSVQRLNLVSAKISRQALTYDLFRRAGLLASKTEFVDLAVNGDYQALYVTVEEVDEPFLSAHLPGDDTGNLYRAKDGGNLSYRGIDPDDYRAYYLKKSNEGTDDFSDVIALTDALTNSSDEDFQAAAEAVADMEQWVRWFAVNAVVFNREGALFVGQGDDYFLYHRSSDDRFILLPWDHDTTFNDPNGDIWAPNLPIVQRILRFTPYTRLYYQGITSLMENEFSVATMHPLIDALPPELDGDKEQLKQFVTDRINNLTNYFNINLPDRTLAITTNDGQSFTTTEQSVVLEGECSPLRNVYVNGKAQGMTYTDLYGWRYTTPPLRPHANRFIVTDRKPSGEVVTTRTITVTFDAFGGGILAESLTLTLEASPYIIVENLVVPPSLTLTIEPGVIISFAEGVSLFVEGQLLAEGTVEQPITFTRDLGVERWGAIGIYGSHEDNRLTHVLVEYTDQASYKDHTFSGVGAYDAQLTFQNSEIRETGHAALDIVGSNAYVRRNWVHRVANGAGLHAQDSYVEIEHNLFHDLFGDSDGLSLSNVDGNTGGIIRNNVIYGVSGDCIYLENVTLPIERNKIHHCTGAGVYLSDTTYWTGTTLLFPTMVNNLIHHNVVGIAVRDGAATHIAHNTLAYNTVGLAVYDSSQATVVNSIVWNSGTAISHTVSAPVTVSYSDIQGGWSGTGNIDADPQFRRPDAANFRLLETSPCIDRGTPRGAVSIDLTGIPRPIGEGYDMGAFEFYEYHVIYLSFAIKP